MMTLIKNAATRFLPLLMVAPFLALPFVTMTMEVSGGSMDKQGAGFVLLMSLQRNASS